MIGIDPASRIFEGYAGLVSRPNFYAQLTSPMQVDPWEAGGRRTKTPTLPKTGRIGHPGKPIQSLGVDVQEWYHPIVSVGQWEENERVCHPPNGEEYVNDKTGEKVEWNKGRPGQPGNRGKDHWHYTPPGGERGEDHYKPGETVQKVVAGAGVAGAVAVVIHAIVESVPYWVPALAF
jgi:hypothetical protein